MRSAKANPENGLGFQETLYRAWYPAMACIGGYLMSNQVSVAGSYWSFHGGNTCGITLYR
jgi:hypothetical protein